MVRLEAKEECMSLFDLWLVGVTLLFFLLNACFAMGCDRVMGGKR